MKIEAQVFYLSGVLVAAGLFWAVRPESAAQGLEPQITNALTLDAAVELALISNPGLLASDARVDAAAGRARQAGRWANPELEFSIEEWPVNHGGSFSDSKQTIGVRQEIPFPGKKALDRRLGGAEVRASERVYALRQTALVRNVKAAFFRVLAAQQAVEVSEQLLSVAESSAATAGKRVDAGAAAFQEQLRAEVQREQARTELRDLERRRVAAMQDLLAVLGRPDLDEPVLSGVLNSEADPTLLMDEPREVLASHPGAAAAKANLDHARLQHRRAKLEPYPNVSVGAAGGRLGETDQSIVEFGVSIPLPIFDGGRGRQEEALANVRAAEAEWNAVMQQLRREWAAALERYRSAIDQVRRYREGIVPRATEAMRLVQTGFEEGKFGLIDLLDTQRTAAEARLRYQEKLLEMNIAHAELEALLRPHPPQASTTYPDS